jgi:sugar/nucleoside kinase (ribokinase family)
MRFVCIGHCTYDTTLPVNEFPEENKKIRIPNHIECGGGPASNGAYLLAKWGMDTTMVSVVGDDYYGHQVIREFEQIGANTRYIEINNNHRTSSSYIIANTSNGTRTILSSKKQAIRRLRMPVSDIIADAILIDGEHPESAYEIFMNNPDAISVIDAGRLNDETKFLGKKATYVICSKDFAEDFAEEKIDLEKIDKLTAILEKLEEYYETTVIITLEAAGSFAKIDGMPQIIPSIKVTAVDSTGAGDIFHGAFLYFIANGYTLLESIHYASITSAISVTRIGSRYSIPELNEVLEYDNAI